MKATKQIVIGSTLILIAICAGLATSLYIDGNPPSYRFSVDTAGVLTESEAVTVTRKAILESGREPSEFTAIAWGSREYEGKPEGYLARNTINPGSGYVNWRHNSSDPAKTIRVSIEKKDTTIECSVYKSK